MTKKAKPLVRQSQTRKKTPSTSFQATALQTFTDHIRELRRRLMFSALTLLVAGSIAYNFKDQLVGWVLSPLHNEKLVYLTPAGGFSFIFQITLYAGILATIPVIFYNFYAFVKPAIPEKVRHSSLKIIFAATFLMLSGAAFGYFVAIPSALTFLTTFASDFVTASLTADSYLSFVVTYMLGLGILFQLPLILLFWHWISPLTPGKLLKSERYVILGSFVAAAVITPTPDVVNQALVAGPIIVIYQLGVLVIWVSVMKKRANAKRALRKEQVQESPTQPVYVAPLTHRTLPVMQMSVRKVDAPIPAQVTPIQALDPSRPRRNIVSVDGFVGSALMMRPVAKMQPPQVRIAQPRATPERVLPRAARGSVRPAQRSVAIDGFGVI